MTLLLCVRVLSVTYYEFRMLFYLSFHFRNLSFGSSLR